MTGHRRSFHKTALTHALLLPFLLFSPAFGQAPSVLSKSPIKGEEPIEITAERLQYLRDEDRYIADGGVDVVQGSVHLTADHVTLDNRTAAVKAEGHVVLRDADDVLASDRLDFNLRTKSGTAVPGQLFIQKDHYYLDAGRMSRESERRYELKAWTITSCDTEEGSAPLWRFRGRTARAELGRYLVARDVVFYIKDIPVMYTPYLILPVKTERQSGLLVPRFGYGTKDGFRLNESFFWAITPSQDATLTLDYRSLRGVGTGLEYRYKLSRESEGQLRYTLFDDRITNSRRTETEFRHTQRFSDDFQARLDVHLISDINQFRDLSETTSDRVQASLASTFVIFRRWDNQEVYLLARMTRNLVTKTGTTLQQLPQIGYTLREYRLGRLPLYAGLDATAVRFWREEEDAAAGLIRADRMDFFPRLWTRLNIGGVVLTPRAGYRETWYSRDLVSDSPTHRGMAVLELGANTRLSRVFESSETRRWVHHVEPAVLHEYVPFVDQSRLPHFDEVDQLPRKNQATYSLTNRVVLQDGADPQRPTRREAVFWKITQSYDVRARRIEADPGPSRPFSNLRSEVILRPLDQTALVLDAFYNFYRRETVSFNSDLQFQFFRPWTFAVGQRYTREGALSPRGDVFDPTSPSEPIFWYTRPAPLLRFLTGESRIELPGNITLAGRAYYDLAARAFAEIDYGLQYIGQCWAFSVAYRDLPDRNQFSFMITLRPSEMSGAKSLINFKAPS